VAGTVEYHITQIRNRTDMSRHNFQLRVYILLCAGLALGCHLVAADTGKSGFEKDFKIDKRDLSSTGSNKYFVLEPGFTSIFRGSENGETTVLTITVTKKTKIVDGVKTRVIDERETHNGELVEISHNYFAISKKNGDVYYFGEETDDYKNGKMSHGEDSWLSGVNGAHFGLGLPAQPEIGARYCQENAPGTAMDRAEILSIGDVVSTPAGEFSGCLKTEETTPLESGKEYKYYAPNIGLIQDDGVRLVKQGFVGS
jgi:hypothetical protein